jgi:hypothetical protein
MGQKQRPNHVRVDSGFLRQRTPRHATHARPQVEKAAASIKGVWFARYTLNNRRHGWRPWRGRWALTCRQRPFGLTFNRCRLSEDRQFFAGRPLQRPTMRVIFSRKGFDSAAGKVTSPIIEGAPISLPIPTERRSETSYRVAGLGEIVEQTTRGRIRAGDLCHEDPVF